MPPSPSPVSASARGASFLILLQLSTRLLTFLVNQFILRYLSPTILGASVQLELLSITILYFSRESLRVALQRQQADGVQVVVNMAYLAVLMGAPMAVGLVGVYGRMEGSEVVVGFERSVRIYGVATVVELLAEPGFAAASQRMLYKVRASSEGFAALARTVVSCGSVVLAHRNGMEVGVLPFANGQFAYAVVLLGSYIYFLQPVGVREKFSLFPRKMVNRDQTQYILSYFSRPLSSLTFSLLLQSSLKYLLTQGDSLLLTTLASLSDQGAYALASNYGGLVARMLFQPIEESSRNLFARLCTPSSDDNSPDSQSTKNTPESSSQSTDKIIPPSPNILQAYTTLTTLLHIYTLLSLPLVLLAPPLIPVLLPHLLGPRWSSTPAASVLTAYIYYIPFLALNGIIEAFVASVATSSDLASQSIAMGVCFVGFAATAWGTTGRGDWGAEGLVVANCVNLGGRIVWGGWFVRRWFGRRGVEWRLRDVAPSVWASVGFGLGVWAALRGTKGWGGKWGVLGEVMRVVGIGGGFGLLLLYFEREFLMECYRMVRPKKEGPKMDEKKSQ
ncbi:MAG: Oligosaccharide translocation protein rft1 [Bogoriella megaspora]|nr:MAG: Oligosaccharide translocation protein rft1 [Bogoriella megaspora]